jgi:hypothetical protein
MRSIILNPNAKDLRARMTLQQLLGSSQTIIGHFKCSGFNISQSVAIANRHNSAVVACLDLGARSPFKAGCHKSRNQEAISAE